MNEEKWKVLVVDPIDPAGLDILAGDGHFDLAVIPPEEEAVCREIGDAHAVTLRNFRLTADHIAAAPLLRMVSRHGAGFDTVDVAALNARRIPLALASGANAISVAEHAFALLLAVTRQIVPYDGAVHDGNFAVRGRFGISELYGKTLLVVGFGRIGREFARRAASFGMKVLAFDPLAPTAALAAGGAERATDLAVALATADVVSLHVPLTEETRHMIGALELERMKPGAIVLNTARPGLIDEDALAAAIAAERIGGAGLDTFDQKTPHGPEHPFNTSPRVVRSPYVASLARESVIRTSIMTAEAVIAVREGRLAPELLANPEILHPA